MQNASRQNTQPGAVHELSLHAKHCIYGLETAMTRASLVPIKQDPAQSMVLRKVSWGLERIGYSLVKTSPAPLAWAVVILVCSLLS